MRFALCALAAVMAAPAGAVTYFAKLTGTIYHQVDPSFDDPNLRVGETLVLTSRFHDSLVYEDALQAENPIFFDAAHLGNLSTTGSQFFRIDSAKLTWGGDDRFGIYGFPWITFDQGKVTSLYLFTLAADSDATPGIDSYGTGDAAIYGGDHIDGNTYKSPGFWVRWDFAGSSVTTAVPEPATWAMMILGFGLVGASMRRRSVAYN